MTRFLSAPEGSTVTRPATRGESQVRALDGALFMHVGEVAEAERLVKQYHYSRRMPGSIRVCCTWHEPGGLFGDSGPAVAACIYSQPPARWSEPVLELGRLVRTDDADCSLTGLLASSVAYIRRQRITDLLVSFADATQGHHGGIYQAGSWNYDGQRARRMDGVVVNGQFVPGRSANAQWGTQSPAKLKSLGVDAEPHYDEGKHLYWRALTRPGGRKAARLGLRSVPYPKPVKATA